MSFLSASFQRHRNCLPSGNPYTVFPAPEAPVCQKYLSALITKEHLSSPIFLRQSHPQPEELSFYAPHHWTLDSAHGAEIISLILDTSYQESDRDFETPIIEKLNFELNSDLGSIRITSSNIADGLILLNISYLE